MFNLFNCKDSSDISMKYFVQEIDPTAQGQFESIPDETWMIQSKCIETPHGVLKVSKHLIVTEGPLVGIQFTVKGSLDFSSLSPVLGKQDISVLALMRQPHNAWLWAYLFDKNHRPIVNFCGYDELDGLLHFVNEIDKH